MNTKNKQDQKKNQAQETRQQQVPKRQARRGQENRTPTVFHEHEHPETRMTR